MARIDQSGRVFTETLRRLRDQDMARISASTSPEDPPRGHFFQAGNPLTRGNLESDYEYHKRSMQQIISALERPAENTDLVGNSDLFINGKKVQILKYQRIKSIALPIGFTEVQVQLGRFGWMKSRPIKVEFAKGQHYFFFSVLESKNNPFKEIWDMSFGKDKAIRLTQCSHAELYELIGKYSW